jgi:hypothetical protein
VSGPHVYRRFGDGAAVGRLLAESRGAWKATAPAVLPTLLEEELPQQEVGAPIGAWAMRRLLRAHGERKGTDGIESVRIRRATAASVMPSVGGEVRVSVRKAAAVAAPAGRRSQIGRGAAPQRYRRADLAGFWLVDGGQAAAAVFTGARSGDGAGMTTSDEAPARRLGTRGCSSWSDGRWRCLRR